MAKAKAKKIANKKATNGGRRKVRGELRERFGAAADRARRMPKSAEPMDKALRSLNESAELYRQIRLAKDFAVNGF